MKVKSAPFYKIPDVKIVLNLHTGAIDSCCSYRSAAIPGMGIVHNKNPYSHNFWTEVRGGKKIDTLAVFKSKYTFSNF